MPDGTPLSSLADTDEVENVLVFVSDALRYDFLPEPVRDLGVTARAIAPSTLTASSLPSLMTGQYPATHGAWMFNDRLRERPSLLESEDVEIGFDAETVWIRLDSADKPPLRINRLDTESKLEELTPPFTHVIHDVGPHAPYGFENGVFDSTKQFFREHENDRHRLIDLYRRDCRNSAERFIEAYDRLVERELLDETLVIFTSDHGQSLGEWQNGGRFGHGHPMCPATVATPIVFIGAGLPERERYDPLLSGTDIAPTALAAQRGMVPDGLDGIDLWRNAPDPERTIRSDVWQHLTVEVRELSRDVTVYAATSAWDADGGYVFHLKSTAERVGSLLYDDLFRGYSPAWRGNLSLGKLLNFLTLSLAEDLCFGVPGFSKTEARAATPREFFDRPSQRAASSFDEEQRSQLRDLGYLG